MGKTFVKVGRVFVYLCLIQGITKHAASRTTEDPVFNSVSSTGNDDKNTDDDHKEYQLFPEAMVILWWDKVVYSVLSPVLGMTGNILSFILLRQASLSKGATSFYMRALAITDSVCLFAGLIIGHAMRSYDVSLMSSAIFCKVYYFILKSFSAISDWVLACMSVECCIAIAMPFKIEVLEHPRWIKISLGVLMISTWLYFSHELFNKGAQNGGCIELSENLAYIFSTIEFFLNTLFCGIIICVSNIVVVTVIIRSQKKSPFASKSSTEHGIESQKSKTLEFGSIVLMLLSISTAYIILKCPFHIMQSITSIRWHKGFGYFYTTRSDAVHRMLYGILLWMVYFNHCFNFYLYMLSGKEFRRELIRILKSVTKRCSTKNGATESNTVPTHCSA